MGSTLPADPGAACLRAGDVSTVMEENVVVNVSPDVFIASAPREGMMSGDRFMRGWIAACVVVLTIGSGIGAEMETGATTAVWTRAVEPELFVEAYLQQGRFGQAHALVADLRRALRSEPAPASGPASGAVAVRTERSEPSRILGATVTRARVRVLLAEHDWAGGRAMAEHTRDAGPACDADPVVCTFIHGYAAARLASPEAKADLIAEAGDCARQLQGAASDPVSVAELYRVFVRAAMAAAQEETPELNLLITHAVSLEKRLRESGQIDVPLQPATEIAGDLWLQVNRYETARQSYRATLDDWPHRPASLLGIARASVELHDDAAAREAYRALLDLWQNADPTRPELLEAKRALGK